MMSVSQKGWQPSALHHKLGPVSKQGGIMVLGLSLPTFTLLHVLISLMGIVAGLVAMTGLFKSNPMRGWTGLFLATTILTSITGFFFPVEKLLPSHVIGVLSLV